MKKLLALSLITGFFCIAATPTNTTKIGVVNFKSCVDGSKLGKKEQGHFEELKTRFEKTLEAKEKELNDMAPKFTDDYLDTLTPEAEAELKNKFRRLSEELSQEQNQYYNMLSQANYQIMQKLEDSISKAAEKVVKTKGLEIAVKQEACFFASSTLDISKEVIAEMDAAIAEAEKTEKK